MNTPSSVIDTYIEHWSKIWFEDYLYTLEDYTETYKKYVSAYMRVKIEFLNESWSEDLESNNKFTAALHQYSIAFTKHSESLNSVKKLLSDLFLDNPPLIDYKNCSVNTEVLRDSVNKVAQRIKQDIINDITNITGTITDISRLYFNHEGRLHGVVNGVKGSVEISCIGSNNSRGYDFQYKLVPTCKPNTDQNTDIETSEKFMSVRKVINLLKCCRYWVIYIEHKSDLWETRDDDYTTDTVTIKSSNDVYFIFTEEFLNTTYRLDDIKYNYYETVVLMSQG